MGGHVVALAVGALLAAPLALGAQRNLPAFYPIARDRAQAAPNEAALHVVCDRELAGTGVPEGYHGYHLSLLRADSRRILLAAFTKQVLRHPPEAISLHVRYGPLPTALPSASGTLDWAYVYDRNADGRVDYMVYLQNAHPVLPDSLPPDFPTVEREADGRIHATRELLYAIIDLGELVFRHFADDDFDGRIDGAVLEQFDSERPVFVREWRIYRASTPGGPVDQAWAFRHDVADTTALVERGPHGYDVAPILASEPAVPLVAFLERANARLALINGALAQCKLGPDVLETGEEIGAATR